MGFFSSVSSETKTVELEHVLMQSTATVFIA